MAVSSFLEAIPDCQTSWYRRLLRVVTVYSLRLVADLDPFILEKGGAEASDRRRIWPRTHFNHHSKKTLSMAFDNSGLTYTSISSVEE